MARILIIEDDPYVQRMYQRMFAQKDYDINIASNGEEGIVHARKNHPDLILLDIILPGGMDGLQVLQNLKNDIYTKNIPVFMLTNLGDDDTIDKAKALGAESYMVKIDFSPQQLLDRIDKYLTGKITKN